MMMIIKKKKTQTTVWVIHICYVQYTLIINIYYISCVQCSIHICCKHEAYKLKRSPPRDRAGSPSFSSNIYSNILHLKHIIYLFFTFLIHFLYALPYYIIIRVQDTHHTRLFIINKMYTYYWLLPFVPIAAVICLMCVQN